MLAYAANRPRIAERQSSPNILLIVLCAHIIVAAVVMSIKMDLPGRVFHPPTTVISIPLRKTRSLGRCRRRIPRAPRRIADKRTTRS
ncbi:MAG TPA: hypothetical protein VH392_11055 [Sphingomicrobium sp.]